MLRPSPPHAAAAALVALALVPTAPAAAAPPRPDLQARAAIVVDAATGESLLADSPAARRPIASATKLMTALLTLERARPNQVLPSPAYSAAPIESQIGLRRGERLTVRDLLTALLLESANDAAVSLAENIAGSRAAFVELMNERARELNLSDTSFANPIGLDDPDNYSTARDLATLTRRLMDNPLFRSIVDRPRATLRTGARRRVILNRNALVRTHPFVDGVKTGHTLSAGFVLIRSATARGQRVVSVVLGEPSEEARQADTLALLRYGLRQFRRITALRKGRVVARAGVRYRDDRRVRLVAADRAVVTVRRGERVATRVDSPEEVEGPLAAGSRVGSVAIVYRGRTVRRIPVVTAEAVPGAGLLRKVTATVGGPLTAAAVAAILLGAGLIALRLRASRRRRASALER